MPCAIRIEDLTKDYAIGFWRRRSYRALDRLTLEIDSGEVFGFLGPNGAGKTTTLKLLMQLIFPTSGRAEILGRPVGDISTRTYNAAHTGAPMFSVYMVIHVPTRIHIAALREEFMDLCDHMNLDAILEPLKS